MNFQLFSAQRYCSKRTTTFPTSWVVLCLASLVFWALIWKIKDEVWSSDKRELNLCLPFTGQAFLPLGYSTEKKDSASPSAVLKEKKKEKFYSKGLGPCFQQGGLAKDLKFSERTQAQNRLMSYVRYSSGFQSAARRVKDSYWSRKPSDSVGNPDCHFLYS